MSGRDAIIGTLKDGSTMIEKTITEVVGAGTVFLTVQLPVLRSGLVWKILEIHITQTDPKTAVGSAQMIEVSGNVCGFTLAGIVASTTLSYNLAAIGA